MHQNARGSIRLIKACLLTVLLGAIAGPALAEPIRIMPFGDSWTQGAGDHVSYRYDLYFLLKDAGYDVDFVGNSTEPFSGPDLSLYPRYQTEFDPDHQGTSGFRADQLAVFAGSVAAKHKPHVLLLWAGTNDIDQMGADGVGNAQVALREIITKFRSEVPGITVLFANAMYYPGRTGSDHIETLNAAINSIVQSMHTEQSPVILVDQYNGFDNNSMMQADRIHHNRVGEAWVAQNWFEALVPNMPEAETFRINAGLTDAWYNPATAGQGFLITVWPVIEQMFVAWFTFDTERPPGDVEAILGEPGHRWLTAQGPYSGDTANLTLYLTEGGEFDAISPPAVTDPDGYGTLTIEFADCNAALASYDITSPGISGSIPLERIVLDNVPFCESQQ